MRDAESPTVGRSVREFERSVEANAGLSRLDLGQRLNNAVARQLNEHRHPKRRAASKCEQVARLDRPRDVSDAEVLLRGVEEQDRDRAFGKRVKH